MKAKIIMFLLIVLFSLIINRGYVIGSTSYYGDAWESVYFCSGDNILIDDAANTIYMSPWDERHELISEMEGYCVNLDQVGTIYDYNSDTDIVICPNDTITALKNDGSGDYVKNVGKPCCFSDAQYFYPDGMDTAKCCEYPNLSNCNGIEAINETDSTGKNSTGFFPQAEVEYLCKNPNCFFVDALPSDAAGTYTEHEITVNNYSCFLETDLGDFSTSITPTPISINQTGYHNILNYYCLGGDVLTEAEFDNYRENLGPYLVCREYKDSDAVEYDRCLACINPCSTCIYSSLGCIDATLNGVITTIMRMGIGVIGAVGILRIMQAAILRQSADPKDVQESWEIIMSVVLGTVVLLASSLILRVIGIDLLGILPFDF